MLHTIPAYSTLLDGLAVYAEATDGRMCKTKALVTMAEQLKNYLDVYFGVGNWHSGMLVRYMTAVLEDYPEDVPCEVLKRMHSIARHASESAQHAHDSLPRPPKQFPSQ